ncbi:MAG: hypothetical protein ACI4OR_02535 [Alphaproteobacteria bacterium]
MRPLTEALFRENEENLAQKGWKPSEQRRCFKKADALLDYMSQMPEKDYQKSPFHSRISPAHIAAMEYLLQKDMPSHKMQVQSLDALSMLLSIGEEMLWRSAWLFKKYPALFKAKYALSPQAFAKDIHGFFIRGRLVPENSFSPFKTGENPAFSNDRSFINRCIKMYKDPIFETAEFKMYREKDKSDKDPYLLWKKQKKAGQKFSDKKAAWELALVEIETKAKSRLQTDKIRLAFHLIKKKQKNS